MNGNDQDKCTWINLVEYWNYSNEPVDWIFQYGTLALIPFPRSTTFIYQCHVLQIRLLCSMENRNRVAGGVRGPCHNSGAGYRDHVAKPCANYEVLLWAHSNRICPCIRHLRQPECFDGTALSFLYTRIVCSDIHCPSHSNTG